MSDCRTIGGGFSLACAYARTCACVQARMRVRGERGVGGPSSGAFNPSKISYQNFSTTAS